MSLRIRVSLAIHGLDMVLVIVELWMYWCVLNQMKKGKGSLPVWLTFLLFLWVDTESNGIAVLWIAKVLTGASSPGMLVQSLLYGKIFIKISGPKVREVLNLGKILVGCLNFAMDINEIGVLTKTKINQ